MADKLAFSQVGLTQKAFCIAVSMGFLVGCTSYLDAAKVQDAISQGIKEQTGLNVKSVACPEKQKIETDASFDCDVTMEDGQTIKAGVTQTDDQGNISWNAQEGLQSLEGVIDNESLAKQITDGILQQTQIDVKTDCGGLFRVARKGTTFTCTTTDVQNNKREVKVTAQDDEGNVSWEL